MKHLCLRCCSIYSEFALIVPSYHGLRSSPSFQTTKALLLPSTALRHQPLLLLPVLHQMEFGIVLVYHYMDPTVIEMNTIIPLLISVHTTCFRDPSASCSFILANIKSYILHHTLCNLVPTDCRWDLKKKILFIYFQREEKGGRKRGRETSM